MNEWTCLHYTHMHHFARLSYMWSSCRWEAFVSLCEQMIIQHSRSKLMILLKKFFFHAAYSVKLMENSQGLCGLGMSKQQWVGKNSHPGHFSGSVQFSSVQSLSHVWLFVTPWTAAQQASLSITNSQTLLRLMSNMSVMPSNLLSSVVPFSSHLQSFPASGSFPMSQFFTSGGQSTGVSASALVLPMNTQDWSPLGWTGWTSLQSKGLSRVFSNTTVQKHQFFGTQLCL